MHSHQPHLQFLLGFHPRWGLKKQMEEDEGEAEDGEMEDEGGRQSIGFKFLFGFYRILVLCKKYE